jgi:hypothetical protein
MLTRESRRHGTARVPVSHIRYEIVSNLGLYNEESATKSQSRSLPYVYSNQLHVKVKNEVPLHAMKAYRGIRSIAPLIFNPLNAELNPIFHLLALLGARPIFHFSRIRVNHGTSFTPRPHYSRRKARYSLYRRRGEPQGRSRCFREEKSHCLYRYEMVLSEGTGCLSS